MTEQELNVISKVSNEFELATNQDEVNKIYRQVRNWSRYHCYYAKACTPETLSTLNKLFKSLRVEALNRLGVA